MYVIYITPSWVVSTTVAGNGAPWYPLVLAWGIPGDPWGSLRIPGDPWGVPERTKWDHPRGPRGSPANLQYAPGAKEILTKGLR